MYWVRPAQSQLPRSTASDQLEALERRWRLADQQVTFRNSAPIQDAPHPFRPRLTSPYRRQRPPC